MIGAALSCAIFVAAPLQAQTFDPGVQISGVVTGVRFSQFDLLRQFASQSHIPMVPSHWFESGLGLRLIGPAVRSVSLDAQVTVFPSRSNHNPGDDQR